MRISDWSSDVCSSDLEDIMNNLDRAHARRALPMNHAAKSVRFRMASITGSEVGRRSCWRGWRRGKPAANRYFCDARDEQRRLDRAWSHDRSAKIRQRSEEHTSELQSLMRISYAVFCLKKKTTPHNKK